MMLMVTAVRKWAFDGTRPEYLIENNADVNETNSSGVDKNLLDFYT